MELPDEVASSLARSVGAYIRATADNQLPTALRPFKRFSAPKALLRHRDPLVASLDDDAVRALVKEWLEEDKPRMSANNRDLLLVALDRPEGWDERLRSKAAPSRKATVAAKDGAAAAERRLEQEREKVRKAKESERKGREEARRAVERERARLEDRSRDLQEAQARIRAVESEARSAVSARDRALAELERSERKSKAAVARAIEQRDAARKELSEYRKRVGALEKKVAQLERDLAKKDQPAKKVAKPARPPQERKRLPVPKGRFEDAPETLEQWLKAPNVRLLVDGYNVTKAETGYRKLELEAQRERLIDGLKKLVLRRPVQTTIVFDGADVAGRRARRPHALVQVQYSSGQIADDHLIELLDKLPNYPVIIVTNDRELRGRAERLGATIAGSDQLLSIIK